MDKHDIDPMARASVPKTYNYELQRTYSTLREHIGESDFRQLFVHFKKHLLDKYNNILTDVVQRELNSIEDDHYDALSNRNLKQINARKNYSKHKEFIMSNRYTAYVFSHD